MENGMTYKDALTIATMALFLRFGNADLIESCSLPWETYRVYGALSRSAKECQNICSGNAFHTEEGTLICFNEKGTPHHKFIKSQDIESGRILCDCGCLVYGVKGKTRWTPCEGNQLELTRKECKARCKGMTMYLYKRQHKRHLLHCEHFERKQFYDVVGDIRTKINSTDSTSGLSKRPKCTCGVAENILKPDGRLKTVQDTLVEFEECQNPWRVVKIRVHTTEACLEYCGKVCGRGRGFYYNGRPFCYHSSFQTVKRSSFQGRQSGECECGYARKIFDKNERGEITGSKRLFTECEPIIRSNETLPPLECNEFCRNSFVFSNKIPQARSKVLCLRNPDFKLLNPQQLLPRCDLESSNDININAAAGGGRKHVKCRCGLNKFDAVNNSKNMKIKGENAGITKGDLDSSLLVRQNNESWKVPDAWKLKKKRTSRIRGKSSMENQKCNT